MKPSIVSTKYHFGMVSVNNTFPVTSKWINPVVFLGGFATSFFATLVEIAILQFFQRHPKPDRFLAFSRIVLLRILSTEEDRLLWVKY